MILYLTLIKMWLKKDPLSFLFMDEEQKKQGEKERVAQETLILKSIYCNR